MTVIQERQLGAAIQLSAAIALLRATIALWPGWWWLATMPPAIWLAIGGALSFRSAWLIQWKG